MDNTVGRTSNEVLFQKCFSSTICELGENDLDLFRNQQEQIFKLCYQAGLYLQAINNLSDFILPNPNLTATEKTVSLDYFKDVTSNRMTEPIWRMLNIAKTEDTTLHQQIMESAKNRRYPDPEFQSRVCEFLKKHRIIEQIVSWLKDKKKRILKDIFKVEAAFDSNNPAVAKGFALWKQSMNILTHNKFLEQLKIDYQIDRA